MHVLMQFDDELFFVSFDSDREGGQAAPKIGTVSLRETM